MIESLVGKMLVENKHTVLQQQITQTFLNQWEWVKPPSLAYMEHFTTVPKYFQQLEWRDKEVYLQKPNEIYEYDVSIP